MKELEEAIKKLLKNTVTFRSDKERIDTVVKEFDAFKVDVVCIKLTEREAIQEAKMRLVQLWRIPQHF